MPPAEQGPWRRASGGPRAAVSAGRRMATGAARKAPGASETRAVRFERRALSGYGNNAEMDLAGGAHPPRAGRCRGGGRLPVAPRIAPRDRRRADRRWPHRAGRGDPRPERHSARARPERGGRPLRPRLRPCPGPVVADGNEPPDRGRAPRRGVGRAGPRHRSPPPGARSLPPREGHPCASLPWRSSPNRRVRQRGQRIDGGQEGSSSARVPHRRSRSRALDGGRHGGVGQGDGPRPRARMDARSHAASDVEIPRPGPDPRLLHALPRGHAPRRRASGSVARRRDERARRTGRALRATSGHAGGVPGARRTGLARGAPDRGLDASCRIGGRAGGVAAPARERLPRLQ